MAVKITNPVDILLNERWAWLLYGEPKVGKTFLAGGFPHSVVIACPVAEATTLAQLPNARGISVLGCSTWSDIVDAVDRAVSKKAVPGAYETIVFDNLTPAYSLCIDWTVEQQSRKIIGKHTWNAANDNMMKLLDKLLLTNTDKNVILVAHNRRDKDEDGNVVRIFPDFGESLARKIMGRMNAMFYLRLQGKNRELVTTAIPGIDVGSRYELPRSLTNPTAEQVVGLINQYKAKIKEQNADD